MDSELPANLPQDPSNDALPTSTDESAITIQGANKFQQFGEDAACKLFQALLAGASLPQRCALV